MSNWATGFVIPDIAQVHLAFGKCIELAAKADAVLRRTRLAPGAAATLLELRAAYVDFNEGLRYAAERGAVEAKLGIEQRLQATMVRTDTGSSLHLRDLIRCAPLATVGLLQTGMVGVADVAELERARNPRTPTYGPYWRAQEYGTGGGEVPSQLGRTLFGFFAAAGGGDLTPPQAQYAGGGGPHPIFISAGGGGGQLGLFGAGPRGGKGGLGTIGTEIRAKRFISLGKDGAAVAWRAAIGGVERRAVDRLHAIGAP